MPDNLTSNERVPTHRCKVCGCKWILWPPGSHGVADSWWSLGTNEKCGPCCDNVAMGDQIETLAEAFERIRNEADAERLLRKGLSTLLEAQDSQEATGFYSSAWVIEGAWSAIDHPEYWAGSSRWSSDPYKALRFATRESAQQAADLMCAGMNVRIACHEFAGNSHHE